MGTAYDAILRNLGASYKAKASGYTGAVSNARFISELKLNYLKNLNTPVASNEAPGQSVNTIRDIAMSMMDMSVPKGDYKPTVLVQPKAPGENLEGGSNSFTHAMGKAFGKFADVTHIRTGFSGVGDLVKGAASTGAGKWAIEQMQRTGQASGGALSHILNDKEKEAVSGGNDWITAASAGFHNRAHVYPGTVLRDKAGLGKEQDLGFGKGAAAFALGLAGDVFLDPLSYVPVSKVGRAAKEATKGKYVSQYGRKAVEAMPIPEAIRPLPNINESVPLNTVAPSPVISKANRNNNVLKSKRADMADQAKAFLDSYIAPTINGKGKELELFQKPRFASGHGGIVSDAKNPVDLADEMLSKNITSKVMEAPKLAHPNLDISSPFKEVTTSTTQRVPKIIEELVDAPVAKKTAEKAQDISPKVATFRAIKMALLQAPDHKLESGLTVRQLLEHAQKVPGKQKDIKRALHIEATRLFNTGEYKTLPKLIQFKGKSGNSVPISLTVDQAATLFKHGHIPAAKKTYTEADTQFANQFPLHSPEDLKQIHLNNSSGELVTLHDYMKDYNVPIKSVAADGTVKDVLIPKDTTFGEVPTFEAPVAKVTRKKTIFEEVTTTKKSLKRVRGADAVAWQLEHAGKLSPAELKYISHPSLKPETFEARVAELRLKQVAGNFKTLREFVASAKAGEIPQEFLDDMLKNLGIKNIDELEKKATAILKKTGSRKAQVNEVPTNEVPENFGKVERFKGPAPEWEGVMTPQEIMEKVTVEGPSILSRPRPTPNPILNADVDKAIKDAVKKNLQTPQDKSVYGHTSNRGTLRTSPKLREGVGRNLKGWNSFSQGDALSSLISSSASRFRKGIQSLNKAEQQAQWRRRAGIMYDNIMPAMRVIENFLKDNGVKIIAGKDDLGILMSTTDVLEALPRNVVERNLFGAPGGKLATVKPTGVLNAAEPLVRAALHEGDMGLAKEASYMALMDDVTGGTFHLKGEAGKRAARILVKNLSDAMPTLLQRVNENYAEHSIKVGTSVTSMTQEVVDRIAQMNANPKVTMPDTFSALMDKPETIAAAGRAIKAPPEAVPLATVLSDTGIVQKGIAPGDLAEAKTTKAVVAEAKKSIELVDRKIGAQLAQHKSRVAEAETLSQQMGEEVVDMMDYINLHVEAGLFRSYIPLLQKAHVVGEHLNRAFKTNTGMPDIHETLWKTRNTSMEFGRMHRSLVSDLSKYVATTVGADARQYEQQAFKALQSGAHITDEAMIPVMNAMKDSIDLMFTAGEKGNASLAIRNGLFPDHLNAALDYFGAPKSMRFEPNIPLSEQADVWKTWDNVSDPLDALDKTFAAYQFALTDATVGKTFSAEFGSTYPKPGYVKLTDKSSGSILHKFLDHELYYPEDIAKQIPYYDSVRKAATQTIQNKNLAYTVHLYDTALHGIKTGLTVVRPGHHASNLYGDMIMSFLGGVTSPLAYRRGMRVLAGRTKMYHDWDGMKALAADTEAFGAIPGKDIKVGRGMKMTDDETFRAAYNEGLLGGFRQTQALDFNEGQGFAGQSLNGNVGAARKAGRAYMGAMGGVADIINHNVRMSHFIDALGKSKAKTLEEAIKDAGHQVRKWHPDGSDLTPFEKKYMRRTVLFYSWMKKSTPLIVQAMLQKPGRVMVLPKAQYEFASVMGMNPDSMSDPFPQGSVYPSFITDSIIGPQFRSGGHEMGLGLPGDPISGTANGVMNNPLTTLLNGLSPALKIPKEVVSGKRIGTDIPITDKSDYIDQQIPLVSNLANITNFSPSGMQPQNDVTKGNAKPGIDKAAAFNFMAGLGLKQYDKPSYKARGLSELRQKHRAAFKKGGN